MEKNANFHGYVLGEEEYDFVCAMKEYEEGQSCFSLKSAEYEFHVDPQGGKITIWHDGQLQETFDSIDEMVLHFCIAGKRFIDFLDDFDFC